MLDMAASSLASVVLASVGLVAFVVMMACLESVWFGGGSTCSCAALVAFGLALSCLVASGLVASGLSAFGLGCTSSRCQVQWWLVWWYWA